MAEKKDSISHFPVERLYQERKEFEKSRERRREFLSEKEKGAKKEIKEMGRREIPESEEAEEKSRQVSAEKDEIRKLTILFNLAEEKGLGFALRVARKTKDPWLVDVFHDLLAKEGNYKKFI